ncbi:NAD(P)/FAD-dependent oxidoreductase [Eubacteriaceae bacterium ES2]|nr:NAD(P)/FAD-dependent oxidoreductase [Eubacteriaceae bacterium ES2]
MSKIGIVGGGPAGMMAAFAASEAGHQVDLYEQNEKLGKKLYITGKGRCNLTNACDREQFFKMIVRNPRFMYSALNRFDSQDFMAFMEAAGVPLKIERGDRVFPVSDKSSDVIRGFAKSLEKNKVVILLNQKITGLEIEDNRLTGLRLKDDATKAYDAVILATGGKSYSSTGSDGFFFEVLKAAGHTITPLRPALVPVNTCEQWPKSLQGLSLKNVHLTLYENHKKIAGELGEMLFTHFGISGPLVLSLSSLIKKDPRVYSFSLDLKPGLSEEALDKRISRDFLKYQNRDFSNSLNDLLPAKMIPVIIEKSGIDPLQKVNQITRENRQKLVKLLKSLEMQVESLRGFKEAIITAGGVSVKEVNPSSMESKLIKNLYLTGEMLDIDALTGGYNIQLAVSTGFLAGQNV